MTGRYYFHLTDRTTVIPDDSGVAVADLAAAQRAAMDIIAEFKAAGTDDINDLSDWMLVVTDESERFALVLPICP
jgi:hypothetical protein